MKRLISFHLLSFIFLFSASLFAFGNPVHAQSNGAVDDAQAQAAATAAAAEAESKAPASLSDKPSIGKLTAPADTSSYDGIMSMLMGIFAWLVGAAAILLDGAVYYTVVKMGTYVNNLSAISTAWHILRDIGNIVLIFGFIAIGIGVIVDSGFYGGGTKMLPTLLLAAVFLNFSLFISEAVIDVGNLFATQFYTQINGGMAAGQKSFADSGVHTEGISNKIMAQIGLQTIYNVNFEQNKIAFKAGNMWIVGFMSIILFLVAAFVMFSLAFVLIARFVYLIYLIIASPIGFAGLAVPRLEGFAKDWWKSLFEQTITAPILMLLLYVALLVITSPAFLTGFGIIGPKAAEGAYLSWLNGEAVGQLASVLLSFLVAMGLLLAVVVVSKKMSAFGAEAASKWGGKLSFGVAGFAGRNTVGWGANSLAKGLRKTRFARIPLVGTGVVRGLEGVGKSSFDVRGTSYLKDFPMGSINAGDAQKGGYAGALKKQVDSRTKYAEGLRGRDLKGEENYQLAVLESGLSDAKKTLSNARTVEQVRDATADIKRREAEINLFHKRKGTERGNKTKYGETLSSYPLSFLAANEEAGKKIKEEAKKSKNDKDVDALRKMLNQGGGEAGAAPAAGGGGGAAGGGAPGGGAAPRGGGGAP